MALRDSEPDRRHTVSGLPPRSNSGPQEKRLRHASLCLAVWALALIGLAAGPDAGYALNRWVMARNGGLMPVVGRPDAVSVDTGLHVRAQAEHRSLWAADWIPVGDVLASPGDLLIDSKYRLACFLVMLGSLVLFHWSLWVRAFLIGKLRPALIALLAFIGLGCDPGVQDKGNGFIAGYTANSIRASFLCDQIRDEPDDPVLLVRFVYGENGAERVECISRLGRRQGYYLGGQP